MSRIGKKPIELPSGVTATLDGQYLEVKGPKGTRSLTLVDEVKGDLDGNVITVTPRDESKRARSMWGMSRTLVSNLAVGVSTGYTKDLEITGVGYRASVQGRNLQIQLGFSHDVIYPIPEGIEIKCEKPTSISISGVDKDRVGQVAAEIRAFRPPEPYKGKGVKYAGEYIFRKEGKKK
ncbi:MAG: 50S ribosomal protein L6 [Alphaproteobacteria bacterium]|nr:50S ribosomal protein L6 [Alphaproteobacteria bacterium]MDX5370206.1 50S ribosomal protein L6 [Alphaproteobacteria bacterium]MDX5464756.1 50S ribosomal protein L6 [Alphaproteobacteria bacterium]